MFKALVVVCVLDIGQVDPEDLVRSTVEKVAVHPNCTLEVQDKTVYKKPDREQCIESQVDEQLSFQDKHGMAPADPFAALFGRSRLIYDPSPGTLINQNPSVQTPDAVFARGYICLE